MSKLGAYYESGVLVEFFDATILDAAVKTLEEELRPHAYHLCAFALAVLDAQPDLLKDKPTDEDQGEKHGKKVRSRSRAQTKV